MPSSSLRIVSSTVLAILTCPLQGQERPDTRWPSEVNLKIQAAIDSAKAEGLPHSGLTNRVNEARARGINGSRAAEVVRNHLDLLRRVKRLLPDATPDELDAGTSALRAGIREAGVAAMRGVRQRGQGVVALLVMADLARRGADPIEAARTVSSLGATRSDQSLLALQQAFAQGPSGTKDLQPLVRRLFAPERRDEDGRCCDGTPQASLSLLAVADTAGALAAPRVEARGALHETYGNWQGTLGGQLAVGRGPLGWNLTGEVERGMFRWLRGHWSGTADVQILRRQLWTSERQSDSVTNGPFGFRANGGLGVSFASGSAARVRLTTSWRVWGSDTLGVLSKGVSERRDTLETPPRTPSERGFRSSLRSGIRTGVELSWLGTALSVHTLAPLDEPRSLAASVVLSQRVVRGLSAIVEHSRSPRTWYFASGDLASSRWRVGLRAWALPSDPRPEERARTSRTASQVTAELQQSQDFLFMRVRAPGARSVTIQGDLTGWTELELQDDGSGSFREQFPIQRGLIRLRVRVDGGSWFAPPGLPVIADDFGGEMGVFVVQ